MLRNLEIGARAARTVRRMPTTAPIAAVRKINCCKERNSWGWRQGLAIACTAPIDVCDRLSSGRHSTERTGVPRIVSTSLASACFVFIAKKGFVFIAKKGFVFIAKKGFVFIAKKGFVLSPKEALFLSPKKGLFLSPKKVVAGVTPTWA